jgi:hypothetical protein
VGSTPYGLWPSKTSCCNQNTAIGGRGSRRAWEDSIGHTARIERVRGGEAHLSGDHNEEAFPPLSQQEECDLGSPSSPHTQLDSEKPKNPRSGNDIARPNKSTKF